MLRYQTSCDILFSIFLLRNNRNRLIRLQDISHHRRLAPQDVSHPSSRRFAPVAVTICPSLRRFAPYKTFRTHGRRFAPYVRRFAPYVRRFAPYWDVSPPRKTFRPLYKLRHFDPPCETFRHRCYTTFRTLEKTYSHRSQFFIKFWCV